MSRFRIPFSLKSSLVIEKSPSEVRPYISTFAAQQKWSPWMVMERDATLKLEGTDGEIGAISYREGKRIGSGYQICKNIQENKRRDGQVIFTAPRKSKGNASIQLEEISNGHTNVTRSMESDLPRFLFWMKATMTTMIGKDYMRGLKMLKNLAETGELYTETIWNGVVENDALTGIGIKNGGHISQIGDLMTQDFGSLHTYTQENNVTVDAGYAIYTKTDIKKDIFEFISTMGATQEILDSLTLPEHMQKVNIPAGKYIHITHKGSYDYLPNSRSALYSGAMNLKIKVDMKAPSYEKYVIGPIHTDNPDEYITEVYAKVK